jgi:hypothetical protein
MEIRIIGTEEELSQAAELISSACDIAYKSRVYRCRNNNNAYRLYIKTKDNTNKEEKQLEGQMSFDEV